MEKDDLNKSDNQYRDWIDKHNGLSRFAGLVIVIVYLCIYYIGLYTDKTVPEGFVMYASLAMMLVFGGAQVVGNNIGKILDIVKQARGR